MVKLALGVKYRKKLVRLLVNSLRKSDAPPMFLCPFDMMGAQIMSEGLHERGYLDALISYLQGSIGALDQRCFIDVGANIGNHAVFFSSYFSGSYAFEPMPLAHKIAEANLMMNGATDVQLFKVGLGEESLDLPFWQEHGNLGGSGFLPPSLRRDGRGTFDEIRCSIICGDDFEPLSSRNHRVGLVKIDVEGLETSVLRGLKRLLVADGPVVVFESHGDSGMEQIDLLRGLGYRHFSIISRRSLFGIFCDYKVQKVTKLQDDRMYPMVIAEL